jgi:hypothetical protein
MFLISNRSLASGTRQDPGAATLMAEVDGENKDARDNEFICRI